MKYLSLLVFLFAMYWTWGITQKTPAVNELAHIGIQDDLKKIITTYITENLPSARDIRFEKFWTETLKNEQVKALFLYSFEDTNEENEIARISIEGYAILNREASEDPRFDIWSFDELFILNNKVSFAEGVTIKANSADE